MWLIFALSSAFAVSLRNVFTRKLVFVTDNDVLLFARYFIVVVLLLPALLIRPWPQVETAFYFAAPGAAFAELFAYIAMFKAIRRGELGSTFPLIAFTPIFMIATGYLILSELPSAMGLIGIFAIVIGAYSLRIESLNGGPLAPIRALARENAARYMLTAAFLFSFAAAFYKKAVIASSAPLALFAPQVIGVVLFTSYFIFTKRLPALRFQISKYRVGICLLGLAAFLESIGFIIAINMALAPYVISVKRTSILFTIILGFVVFREKYIIRSLLAGAIMLLGIFLIAIA